MEIFDFEQGSAEWLSARAGIPTASEFATIMASGRGGGESKMRLTYLRKLAGEIITGEPTEAYTNAHMERGHAMEPEARDLYCLLTDAEIQRVGFVRNGQTGCSPDALVGNDGILEIKTKLPHLLIELLLADKFPADHVAQCQGNLWVAEREWIDIVVYWPKMPPLIKRAQRDEAYIRALERAVDEFNVELAELVEKIRRYGDRTAA